MPSDADYAAMAVGRGDKDPKLRALVDEQITAELEANIEHRIVKYIEGLGGLALKLILASERGFPDRTMLLPGGLVLFIEIKRPKEAKIYHMQLQWQDRLRRRGFRCEFVTSVEQVAALVKEMRNES